MKFESKQIPKEKLSSDETPKRDFKQTLKRMKGLRETSDYTDLVSEIRGALNHWEDQSSKDTREYYPGWDRKDFEELLDQLGENESQEQKDKPSKMTVSALEAIRERDVRERREKTNDQLILDTQNHLYDLQARLRTAEGPVFDNDLELEKVLKGLETSLKHNEEELKELGWFAKVRKTEEVKGLREDIERLKDEILSVKKKIEENPVDVRLKKLEKKRQKKEDEKQDIMEQIQKTTAELKKLKQGS
jgi:hypothetical protein